MDIGRRTLNAFSLLIAGSHNGPLYMPLIEISIYSFSEFAPKT